MENYDGICLSNESFDNNKQANNFQFKSNRVAYIGSTLIMSYG